MAVEARIVGDAAVIALPTLLGTPGATLSKRGAGHLGRWLLAWSRPRAKMTLWGVGGIMQECGCSRATAYKWIADPGFPESLEIVGGNGQVWEADAVKAWLKLNPRRTGRPRKRKGRGA